MPHSQKLTFYLRKANNNNLSKDEAVKGEHDHCHNHHHQHHHSDDHHDTKHKTNSKAEAHHEFIDSKHSKQEKSHEVSTKNSSVQTEDLNQNESKIILTSFHENGFVNDENQSKAVRKSEELNETASVDDDCCTFVTKIRLKQVIDDADESAVLPVSVNLPKDILRNVISEMVRYEQDEIAHKSTANTTKPAQHSSVQQ